MALDSFFQKIKDERKLTLHYYGDVVRALFLLGALTMLLTLPLAVDFLPVNILIAILIILGLGFLAGLTNPEQKWTMILDVLISVGGLVVFEYYAVTSFLNSSVYNTFFWINQLLAIIFLFALYYATKSTRGMMLRKK